MESVIKELLSNGIQIELTLKNNQIAYKIYGFYKSDHVTLYEESDGWYAEARYNEVTSVTDIDDLIELNYDWWQLSRERADAWSIPSIGWSDLMIKRSLLKIKVTTTYDPVD